MNPVEIHGKTLFGLMALALLMLLGAVVLGGRGDVGGKMYSDLVMGLGMLGFALVTGHGVGTLAGGGGIKGAWAALTTSAKPEAVPPEKEPQ